MNPDNTLSDKAREALSHVIVTATEGGHYTREDYTEWTTYVHKDTPKGFYAEVTVHPCEEGNVDTNPVRLDPDELGSRLREHMNDADLAPHHRRMIVLLLEGDEDIAGEMDVIDAGAIFQIAIYGEVIFG